MSYSVKEIFYSLQGEGARTGRPAVFCRFSGCNLWSGEEKHRQDAECRFCDTDFVGCDGVGGGKFADAAALASNLASYWPLSGRGEPYVVFTGGEPLLQLDSALIEAMHEAGFEVAVESNGTLAAPQGIDWLCISPKGRSQLVQTSGDELKLVFPQEGIDPADYLELEFGQFYLQPMDRSALPAQGEQDADTAESAQRCTEYCLQHPSWKLSLQTHKFLGIR